MRNDDDNHEIELWVYSRDDEANLHDSEGSRSDEELHPIAGRYVLEIDFVEPPGTLIFVVRTAQRQTPRDTEEKVLARSAYVS